MMTKYKYTIIYTSQLVSLLICIHIVRGFNRFICECLIKKDLNISIGEKHL